jgi:sugar (pentulose or hexulose) kinase
LPEDAKWYSATQLVLAPVIGDGWLVVQPLGTGNVAWDWALAQFVDRDQGSALRKAERIFAENLLPPDGLMALPWLNAPNPLVSGAQGGGAFFGLSPSIGPAEMLRAIAASLTFEMARVFKPAAESGAVDSIILGGGAAQAAHFQALLAVFFHPLPVHVAMEADLAGSRGSIYSFSPQAACGRTRRVECPDAALRERAMRQFHRYLALLGRVLGGRRSSAVLRISGFKEGGQR